MNAGGENGEGEFGSTVDDAFLAGFEAWGELGQMQGSLLGTSSSQAPGSTGSGGGGGGESSNGSSGTGIVGMGVVGGLTYRSGLGGSMQSFLGEAGMYADSSHSPGVDSFKDGFDGAGKEFGVVGVGGVGVGDVENCSSSNNSGSIKQENQLIGSCKTELQQHQLCDEDEHEQNDSECEGDEEEQEHDYPPEHDDLETASAAGLDADGRRGSTSELRGLGRIFGVGMHPVVAEAQARAEALVHGRGGKAGSGNVAVDAAEKKRKRAVLSKEERAKQNRDRNREHARNTRLRKKAFVEELKKQVEELVAGREREERERRAEMRRDASLRDMRLQVLLTFLEYRGRGEASRQAWQSVLDEHFEMRMPLTPYRSFPPQQVQGGIRVIKGLEDVLADTASLAIATRGSAIVPGRPNRQDTTASPSQQQQQQQATMGKDNVKGPDTSSSSSSSSSSSNGSCSSSSSSSSSSSNGSCSGGSREGNRRASLCSKLSNRSLGATTLESCSGSEEGSSQGTGVRVGAGTSGGAVGRPAAAAAVAGGVIPAGVAAAPTRIYYVVDPKEMMVNKNAFMCPFVARSPQVLVPGMLRCTFSTKSNRLSSVHLSFDPTVPAKQLARAKLGTRLMQGMMGSAGSGPPQAGAGGDAPGTRVLSTSGSGSGESTIAGSTTTTSIGQESEGDQGGAGQEGGVLQSILDDIWEWRVSSTLVDNPTKGKSYLRVYPLNGDTPGVTHFIGVLETLAAGQAAASATAGLPGVESMVESVVNSVAKTVTSAGVMAVSSGGGGGGGKGTAGSSESCSSQSQSQREAGSSEGETSSDSTSSRRRRLSPTNGSRPGSGGSSGSGGSDDGTGTSSRVRCSRSLSAATTDPSDGSSTCSGYETRRSTRRLAATAPDHPAGPGSPAVVGSPGSGGTTRARGRADGSKRARS